MINFTVRRSALGLAVASLVLGASAPAFALTPSARTPDGDVVQFNSKSGDYCLTENRVDSRIAKVTCQSQNAWTAEGLNISRK